MSIKLGVPSKGRLMEKTFDWFGARGVTLARTGSDREYSGAVAGDRRRRPGSSVRRERSRANWPPGAYILASPGTDLDAREAGAPGTMQVEELAPLGFGHADLIIAVPSWPGSMWKRSTIWMRPRRRFAWRHGFRMRIATKYHRLVRAFPARSGGVADYQLGRQPGRDGRHGEEPHRGGDCRHHLDGRDPARQPPQDPVRDPGAQEPGHAVSLAHSGCVGDAAGCAAGAGGPSRARLNGASAVNVTCAMRSGRPDRRPGSACKDIRRQTGIQRRAPCPRD